MSKQRLEDRVRDLIPRYEEMFAQRGSDAPDDPLEFHLQHLASYWSRLVGFCRHHPAKIADWIESDLGAYVDVGSEFAHELIGRESPIYGCWQEYWALTQAMLYKRPVAIDAVEAGSRAFDTCLAKLKFDPWSKS